MAQVIYSSAVGGSEMVAAEIAGRLDRSVFDPSVLFYYAGTGPMTDMFRQRSIPAETLGFSKRRLPLWPWWPAILLRRMRIDVLHVHHVRLFSKVLPVVRLGGVGSIVLTEHASYGISRSLGLQSFCRKAVEKVESFCCVSQRLKQYFTDDLGLSKERISVVPNGVDTERFRPGPRGRALEDLVPPGNKSPVVVAVGRLADAKDHDSLLEAVGILKQAGKAPLLVIVGEGERRGAIETKIRDLGLNEDVVLAGSRKDVADLLRGADAYVLSSRREGFPMALLEAMASGVPVVATRVGGIPEAVEDGVHGYLVSPEEPRGLAGALGVVLTDRAKAAFMAAVARERVVREFSLEGMAERYSDIYLRVAATGKR